MSLDPQLRRSIRRLKELETLGEQLRQTATEPDPDAFGPTTVDREKFAAWRAQVIAFLDESGQRAEQFLGAFKKLRDAPLLDSVTEGLSILQGCRNHLSSAPPSGTTTPQNELMGTTPNIADRAIKRIRNHPAVSVLIFACALLAGLAAALGNVEKVAHWFGPKPTSLDDRSIEILVTMQPYDLSSGPSGPAQDIVQVTGTVSSIESLATSIATQVAGKLAPSATSNVELTLLGDTLFASQPILLDLPLNSPLFSARTMEEIPLRVDSRFDLAFWRRNLLSYDNSMITFLVNDPSGRSDNSVLQLYRRAPQLSFEPRADITRLRITLNPHQWRLALQPFPGAGAEASLLQDLASRIDYALRKRLHSYRQLILNSRTVSELNQERERLSNLPFTPRKLDNIRESGIDYAIEGHFRIH